MFSLYVWVCIVVVITLLWLFRLFCLFTRFSCVGWRLCILDDGLLFMLVT